MTDATPLDELIAQLPPAGPFSGEKILAHPDHLIPWSKGELCAPVGVELDPTNECNLSCWFCTNAKFRESTKTQLSLAEMIDVVDAVKELGGHSIAITGGGEPQLHDDLPLLIRHIHDVGLDFSLITNGTIWRPEVAELVLRYGTWIRISLDAYDIASYRAEHGQDGFDTVLNHLHQWILRKQALNSDCTIGVGYLTTDRSIQGIIPVTQLIISIGPDYLQFRPVIFPNRDNRRKRDTITKDLGIDYAQMLVVAGGMSTEQCKVLVSLPKYKVALSQSYQPFDYCSGVHFAAVAAADGEVYICCHMRGLKQYSLGNIREQSFREIWENLEHRNQIYEKIQFAVDCMPGCRFFANNKLLGHPNVDKVDHLIKNYRNADIAETHVNFL